MTEKLDAYFSVFNNHINCAHDRAMKVLKAESPEWAQEILGWGTKSIMGIFDVDPTPATKCYIDLVTQFVNEKPESTQC